MKYKKLGKSGIKVSEIGFGAWTIALNWWGKEIEEDEAKRMLKKAYDLGINFFETADMYGKGKSEKLIGEVFSGMRNEVVISTKYSYDFENVDQIGHKELPQRFDTEFTNNALKNSLARLQTDYIDVYGLHNPKLILRHDPFHLILSKICIRDIQALLEFQTLEPCMFSRTVPSLIFQEATQFFP